jgi:hypothetical protein
VAEVFVFGSNLQGIHGAGAAKYAVQHFGAILRQGIGRQGNSYAIPTKWSPYSTLPLDRIQPYVNDFLTYASEHPDDVFMVTRIGCGLAGYKDADMAPMFQHAPPNCILPREWRPDAETP